MKKILILSYHFSPMNVIASQRALGYANHFSKHGFKPTILTFDWSKKIADQYCSEEEFEARIVRENHENYEVIRIPVIRRRFLTKVAQKESSFLYKLWILWSYFSGKLDVRPTVEEFAQAEWHYLNNYVNQGDYDVVLGVFSPHFHLRNCFKLYKKLSIPYALDFRDLWDNRVLNVNYKPDKVMALEDRMTQHFWRKWSKKAISLTITSRPWADKLEAVCQRDVQVVTNGYEDAELTLLPENSIREDKVLRIVHTGSVYHQQKMNLLIEAARQLHEKRPEVKFHLSFVGANRGNQLDGEFSFNSSFEKQLSVLPSSLWEVTSRLPRIDSLKRLYSADVLLFPSFPDTSGTYSGKIFEYLMVRKNILMFPSDNDVCAELIVKTNAGEICENVEEIVDYITSKFEELNTSGKLDFKGNETVQEYTRENQTAKLAGLLLKSL